MKTATKYIAICALLLLPPTSLIAQEATSVRNEMQVASPSDVGMSAEKLAKVVPALKQFVDQDLVVGAIVMVARHGRVVLHEAVGRRDVEANKHNDVVWTNTGGAAQRVLTFGFHQRIIWQL